MLFSPVRRRRRRSEASRRVPAHGNRHTIGKRERLHGVFRSSARNLREARNLRASNASGSMTGPLAGRPTVAGCALPGTAIKNLKSEFKSKCAKSFVSVRQHLVHVLGVRGMTCFIFFRRRIRLAFLVPSRCRLPECMRITFPVDVILNRLAAPRCVFNFSFLPFLPRICFLSEFF